MSSQAEIDALLGKEQARNYQFLEQWSGEALPGVRGVPLLLGLNYDLLQILNMETLKGLGMFGMEEPKDDEEKENE